MIIIYYNASFLDKNTAMCPIFQKLPFENAYELPLICFTFLIQIKSRQIANLFVQSLYIAILAYIFI